MSDLQQAIAALEDGEKDSLLLQLVEAVADQDLRKARRIVGHWDMLDPDSDEVQLNETVRIPLILEVVQIDDTTMKRRKLNETVEKSIEHSTARVALEDALGAGGLELSSFRVA